MNKKIYLYITILVLCSALIFAGCSSEPLKIGLMVDLTGRASAIGIAGRDGAELAVEEINRNGGINGRKISLIVKDDKGLPEVAEKVDKELIDEGVLLGIGHFASGTGLAGLQVFADADKLMVSPTMSVESLTGVDDNFIRVIDSNKIQGEVLARAALDLGNNKKVALMYEKNNEAYSHAVAGYFRKIFEENGGKIVLEDSFLSSSTMDFDEIADKILKTDADGALIVAGGLDLAVITQKIKIKNQEMDIYAGMWAMTEELIANGGKAVEGVMLPGVFDMNDAAPESLSFIDAYRKANSEEPTFPAVYSYETVYMVAEALKACGNKIDTASIKNSIINIGYFKGIQDDFSIDRFGDTDRGYYLFSVKNAEFQRVR